MARIKDGFNCEVCGQKVVWTPFCHRNALLCQNCCAKYDNKGKRDVRFTTLSKESWLPHLR